MNQLVSVIAPAYNHEKYIEDCIYSIAQQTYECKELIIIDDCSPDGTVELIEKIVNREEVKKCFKRIKFIKHDVNKGAYQSINEGLNSAEGFYCTIINTDDLYEQNRLLEMVNALEKSKKQLAFSKVDTIDENSQVMRNEEWEYYTSLQEKIDKYPVINMALLTDNVAISTGNLFFTKELYNKVGEFRAYQYIHDWDFILRSTLIEEPIYVANTNYLYRLHSANSFKELREDDELCARESWAVLANYSKSIKKKMYVNKLISDTQVWEYFINDVICNPDIAHIWYNS